MINVARIGQDLSEYRVTDEKGLEQIRPLWMQSNEHHSRKAGAFRSQYEPWTQESPFYQESGGNDLFQVHIACDSGARRLVGYCVTSITRN